MKRFSHANARRLAVLSRQFSHSAPALVASDHVLADLIQGTAAAPSQIDVSPQPRRPTQVDPKNLKRSGIAAKLIKFPPGTLSYLNRSEAGKASLSPADEAEQRRQRVLQETLRILSQDNIQRQNAVQELEAKFDDGDMYEVVMQARRAQRQQRRLVKQRSKFNFEQPKNAHTYSAGSSGKAAPRKARSKSPNQANIPPGWIAEDWKEDWGSDHLQPSKNPNKKSPVPHLPNMLSYSRRIEGLIESRDASNSVLQDVPPTAEMRPIAELEHGLDRVLFNPGVHWLQDPRSRVYNYSPWLEKIPSVTDFAFDRLTPFIKSSRDEDLFALAKREKKTFSGSTSSLTGMLSQAYFLISDNQGVDTSTLSKHFQRESREFSAGQRVPASVVMNYRDGVYAIDSDSPIPGATEKNVLTWLGTLLEKFLTSPQEEFKRLLRSSYDPFIDTDPRREAYRYAKSDRFVMRSQLDAVDKRLPGTGVFDLKTRAVASIRNDIMNHEENSGYVIRYLHGPTESFEKEYYDLIRSAFLKYSFQVRIGNMDGVLVAYHNTDRIFGFQYVPLEEMEARLYGGPGRGDRVFEKLVLLQEQVLEEVTKTFPKQTIRVLFETRDYENKMNVWVEPVEVDKDIHEDERPIARFEVTAQSFLGREEVSPTKAMFSTDQPWTLRWAISRSAEDYAEIRSLYRAARQRQVLGFALPPDTTMAEMQNIWEQMNWGNSDPSAVAAAPVAEFSSSYFKTPSAHVLNLRELARQGREREMSERRANVGKPKVVWGVPESEWEVWGEVEEDPAVSDTIADPARLEEVAADAETASVVDGADANAVDGAASENEEVASTANTDPTVEQEAMYAESSQSSPSEIINRFKQDAQLGAGYSTSTMNALFAANMVNDDVKQK